MQNNKNTPYYDSTLYHLSSGHPTAIALSNSLLENCHNSDYFPEKYEGTLNIAHLTYDMADLRKRCPYILNFLKYRFYIFCMGDQV